MKPEFLENPRSLVIVWRVTEFCNLGCWFCEYNNKLIRSRSSVDPESVLSFCENLSNYSKESGRDVMVSWIGGEPLVWKPLWEVSRRLKETLKIQTSLTTNGYLLNDPIVQEYACKYLDEITFSIDGIGEHHDNNRSSAGLYLRVLKNISALSELKKHLGIGPVIRVNSILMRNLIDNFDEFYNTLGKIGVEELTLNALGGNEEPSERFIDQQVGPKQIETIRENIRNMEKSNVPGPIILGSDNYFSRLSLQVSNVKVPVVDCRPGQQYLFIDEGGFIAPCAYTTSDFKINISKIDTVQKIIDLPHQLSKLKKKEMFSACMDCPSTNIFGKFYQSQR